MVLKNICLHRYVTIIVVAHTSNEIYLTEIRVEK